MALKIETNASSVISLEEFQERFRDGRFDASDAESLAESGELLRQLSNNKSFLGDIILEELQNGLPMQAESGYAPYVVMLGRAADDVAMRANFWPALTDEDYTRSPDAFVYDVPHDHNFNFLTVGYWGPGYRSSYYEYDYEEVHGYPGEAVVLRKTHDRTLTPDSVLLYRAHRDVHTQLPPESMSITINVMDMTPQFLYRDQYVFDQSASRVAMVSCGRSSPNIFDVAATVAGEEAIPLLLDIFRKHDSEYTRFHALKALARAAEDESAASGYMELADASPSSALRGWAKDYRLRSGLR